MLSLIDLKQLIYIYIIYISGLRIFGDKMVATPQSTLAIRDHAVVREQHARLLPGLSASHVADTLQRDILNGDVENIPQDKVATPGDAVLALLDVPPQQPVPLLALPPSRSTSNVANTITRDILNPDGEGRKDDIPQGKVGVDDLAQQILDNKAKHKKNIIKKRPAAREPSPLVIPGVPKKKRPAAREPSPLVKKGRLSKPTCDSNGLTIKFPGVPKKACPPIEYKRFKIYTDLTMQAWRVKKIGERKDKAASWKANPQEAWKKVLGLLKA